MTLPQEPPLDLLVHRMTWEAEEVLSVELTHPEGKPLPAWEPGAHLDLHTGGQIRQYSLCGDPADTGRYRIAVLNEPSSRGGSRHVHTVLRPGATVTVKGPRNHFALAEAPATSSSSAASASPRSSPRSARPPRGAPPGPCGTADAPPAPWPSAPN